jgi:hypothetical protein
MRIPGDWKPLPPIDYPLAEQVKRRCGARWSRFLCRWCVAPEREGEALALIEAARR